MITKIAPETHKILKRWTRAQFYVYIRPLSSLYVRPDKKHRIYWVVAVEHRTVNWQQWRGEGFDINEIIQKLDLEVPKRDTSKLQYRPERWAGAHAPKKMEKAQRKEASSRVGAETPGRIRKNQAPMDVVRGQIKKKSRAN